MTTPSPDPLVPDLHELLFAGAFELDAEEYRRSRQQMLEQIINEMNIPPSLFGLPFITEEGVNWKVEGF